MIRLNTAVAVLALVGPASAQQGNANLAALSSVQHEMTTCAAYYNFTQQCIKNRNDRRDDELRRKTEAVIDRLLSEAAETGTAIGMTLDAMTSRFAMQLSEMTRLTNNSCTNISSLLIRYADRCKQVTENPDSVLLEYMAKAGSAR
jgi:hypothetical protein